VFAIRTRFFDDFLLAQTARQDVRQVIVIAAGLDTRAFRLDWPPNTRLFELDQREVLAHKDRVLRALRGTPACNRSVVAVDFREPWTDLFVEAGYDVGRRSVWFAEGLTFYLDEAELGTLFVDIARIALPGDALGCDFVTHPLPVDPRTLSWARRPSPQIVGVAGLLHLFDDAGMGTIEENKTLVRDFIERLFTKGDLSAVDEYLAPDFVNHDPPFGASADREGMRNAGAMFRAAFPDWHSEPDLLVGEDDIVVEHFTASGHHRGDMMGVASSGREVSLRGINIFRIRDGRILERWGRLDELGLLEQLGLVTRP
jgi:steroid delta-isomerase-like uncharacterized protein